MIQRTLLGGLIAVLITAALAGGLMRLRGCGMPEGTAEDAAYREFLGTSSQGHVGKVRGGPEGKQWSGFVPCYRQGALQVYAALVGTPGQPVRPAFLVLQRLAHPAPYNLGGELQTDGASIHIGLTQYDREGKPVAVLYRGGPEVANEKTVLSVNGMSYTMSGGRVFLIDLSQTPATVEQVNADLDEFFAGSDEELSHDELVDIVERLAILEKSVSAFLEKVPKP